MGILRFTAIYVGTVLVSFPLMVYGAVSAAEWYLETKVEATQEGPDGSQVHVESHQVRTGRTVVVVPSAQTPDPPPVKVKARKTNKKRVTYRWKGRRTYIGYRGIPYDQTDFGYNRGKIDQIDFGPKPSKPNFADLHDPPKTGFTATD